MVSAPAPTGATQPVGRSRYIRIGAFAGPHGLHGALRLRFDNPHCEVLGQVRRIFAGSGEEIHEYSLERATLLSGRSARVVLKEVAGIDQAERLRGAAVSVAFEDLPALNPGEYYHFQMVGLEAILTDGRRLGRVEEVLATGANDVLVVRCGETEVLVPVIEDVVKTIDLASGRLVVKPVAGLLG